LSSKLLLLVAVAVLAPSIIFSAFMTINQISVLPNRPATTYVFGRDNTYGAQIERVQLNLSGSNVATVTITIYIPVAGRYLKMVGLYDGSGNLLASGSDCSNEVGSRTRTLDTVPDVPVDSVATVRTCIVRIFVGCGVAPPCL